MNSEISEIYVRTLFGENAVQIPFHFITQEAEAPRLLIIGQTALPPGVKEKLIPTKRTHHLVMSDVVIRPHLIVASDHLTGSGVSGIVTSSGGFHLEAWAEHGEVVFDPMGKVLEMERRIRCERGR